MVKFLLTVVYFFQPHFQTNAPMAKMSKGEVKVEPGLSDSEDYHGKKVAVVNPTKNQKPRKQKTKKESSLINGTHKERAFEHFCSVQKHPNF